MRSDLTLRVFAATVILVCVIIYLPGLDGPLLFDDAPALTGNKLVQIDGMALDGWRVAAFSSDSGPLRRPVAMITFAANHAIAGEFTPFQLKAVNLFIHVCIAILLYVLFDLVLKTVGVVRDPRSRQLLALTAAAIWLLHPLNVSTVLYAVQRMAQLTTLFVLAGLTLFMHYRRRWARRGASPGEVVAAALWLGILWTLAVLSKENGALLPWLIIVLEVCLFRGMWAGRSSPRLQFAGWALLVAPLLLLLIVLYSPGSLLEGYARREFSLEERLLTQARLLWRYLGWIAYPNISDMGFQHDDIAVSTGLLSPLTTLLAVVSWPVMLGVAFFLRKRFPLLLLAVLFFLVGHIMESTVLPLEMVYEHRNYLPGVFVCLALATALVLPTINNPRIVVWYPVAGVLIILCSLLFFRVQTWSDELTLSRVNVAHHPDSARANYFYANALLRQYEAESGPPLSDLERNESLLLARHYFELMHQADRNDISALVLLYYLDSAYFPQLNASQGWLEQIEGLLNTRVLQPSDWNALALLFRYVTGNIDILGSEQLEPLLNTLARNYPESVEVMRFRFQYMAATDAEPAQKLALLQRAQALAPLDHGSYSTLLWELKARSDVAGMYEYARLWLLHDHKRHHLPWLKSLFTPSGGEAVTVHD